MSRIVESTKLGQFQSVEVCRKRCGWFNTRQHSKCVCPKCGEWTEIRIGQIVYVEKTHIHFGLLKGSTSTIAKEFLERIAP